MQEAETLCDKIVFLHEGIKIAEGSSDEICSKAGTDKLEDAFIKLTAATVEM